MRGRDALDARLPFSGLIRGLMWLMIRRSISYQNRAACLDVIGIIATVAEAGFRDVRGRHATCCWLHRVISVSSPLRTWLLSGSLSQSSSN